MTQSHFLLSVIKCCFCYAVLYGVCVLCCGGIDSSVCAQYCVICGHYCVVCSNYCVVYGHWSRRFVLVCICYVSHSMNDGWVSYCQLGSIVSAARLGY